MDIVKHSVKLYESVQTLPVNARRLLKAITTTPALLSADFTASEAARYAFMSVDESRRAARTLAAQGFLRTVGRLDCTGEKLYRYVDRDVMLKNEKKHVQLVIGELVGG